MSNALNVSLPPAPDLAGQPPQSGPPAQEPRAAPAPTHGQTVAALRHFRALANEFRTLLENPNLGRTDVKSSIIDGATKLVQNRVISPENAVTQLATVPERPFDQRKWAEQQYTQIVQAQAAVLDHHRSQAVGTGNYELESMLHNSDPDAHMETVRGLMDEHYGMKGQP